MTDKKKEYIDKLLGFSKAIRERGFDKQEELFQVDSNLKGKTMYHGTDLDFDSQKIRPSELGLMGHGTYMTDNPYVAKTYARNTHNWQPNPAKRTKDYPTKTPQVKSYKLPEDVNLLDMQKELGDKELELFNKHIKRTVPKEYYEDYILPKGTKGYDAMKSLQDAMIETEVYTYDGADTMAELAYELQEELGYHGVSHKGGVATKSKPHNVAVMFDPEYKGTKAKAVSSKLAFTTPEGTVKPPKIKPPTLNEIRAKAAFKALKAGKKGLKMLPFVGPAMAAYTAIESSPAQAMYDLEPSGSTVANQSTPESKKHFEEQRKYNTLRKLQRFHELRR